MHITGYIQGRGPGVQAVAVISGTPGCIYKCTRGAAAQASQGALPCTVFMLLSVRDG